MGFRGIKWAGHRVGESLLVDVSDIRTCGIIGVFRHHSQSTRCAHESWWSRHPKFGDASRLALSAPLVDVGQLWRAMSVAATGRSYDHLGRGWWEVPDVGVPHPKVLSGRFHGDTSYHTRG